MDEKRKNKIMRAISQFIKTEVSKRGSKGVVIGMSGGIDSSVAACLAVNALGAEKVFGLILPDSSITPENDTDSHRGWKDKEPVFEKISKK